MQYRNLKIFFTALGLASAVAMPLSVASEGTRGGGKGVYLGKGIYLSDIVQKKGNENACRWRSGVTVYAENPYLDKIFKKLSAVNWYFAEDLQSQIRNASFCFIGKLRPVDTTDEDQVSTYVEEGGPQLGVRMLGDDDSDEVYLDTNIYHSKQTSARSRAYTLIHEIMHSYISLDAPRRNASLRGAVLAIADVETGAIGQADFELGLRKGHVIFPEGAEIRDVEKPFIQYVRAGNTERAGMILQSLDVRELIGERDISALIEALSPEDQAPFVEIQKNWYPNLIGGFCTANKPLVLDALEQPLQSSGFDLLQYCFDKAQGHLPENLKQLYYDTHDLTANIQPYLKVLGQKTIAVVSRRVMANRALVELSATKGDLRTYRPISELKPLTNEAEMATLLRSYFTKLKALLEDGQWEQVSMLSFGSDDFYKGFGVVGAVKQINAVTGVLDQDREMARENYVEVSRRPLRLFILSLKPKVAQEFISHVDQSKLGYSIEISDSQKEFVK